MKFKHESLNNDYLIIPDKDVKVRLPAIADKKIGGYQGHLSDIPFKEHIEGLISRGSNLVAKKASTGSSSSNSTGSTAKTK